MKRLGLTLLLAGILGASCGATLTIKVTAPAQLNAGTCAAPVLSPSPAWPMMMHFAWAGPSSGQDSVATNPGESITYRRSVPAGSYTIRGWASNAYGVGCDSTITKTTGDPPATLSIQ